MDNNYVVLSVETYSNYLEAATKLSMLREMLQQMPSYTWDNIITAALGIEVHSA